MGLIMKWKQEYEMIGKKITKQLMSDKGCTVCKEYPDHSKMVIKLAVDSTILELNKLHNHRSNKQ
jgi:hypothetical protein